MRTNIKDGIKFIQFDIFEEIGINHAVFTRQGGVSKAPFDSLNLGGTVGDDPEHVMENHLRVFRTVKRPFDSRFDVWQVHGKRIICTDSPRPIEQAHLKADGIFTDNPEVTLLMRFADCVPLVFADPIKHVVGVVHAGWQGTVKRIAAEAIEVLKRRYASKPEHLLCAIGPSICKDCYQVSLNTAQQFRDVFGQEATAFIDNRDEGIYLDLWKANQMTLEKAGVKHIERADLCTAHHLEDWYSYRAEKGKTGRFGVVIALK